MLRRRRARVSLPAFIDYRCAGYVPAAHHRLLLDALEAVERGEIDRLMVCMPPGSAKSTYASVEFPAWFLGRNPKLSVIAASHTQELAERFGRRVRNVVASPEFLPVFGFGVADDSSSAGRWDTQQGGEYFAAGVGGSITGRRADLAVIDDPVKSREDADSERARQKAWEWYTNDLLTRLKPGAKQIVVMCMTGDTPVLMADGSTLELRHVRSGDAVASYADGYIVASHVMNWANQGPDDIYEIRMRSGRIVRANERHPFLVARGGEAEWIKVLDLKAGDEILSASGVSGAGLDARQMAAIGLPYAKASVARTTTKPCGPMDIGRRQQTPSHDERLECATDTRSSLKPILPSLLPRAGGVQSAENFPLRTCELIGAANSALITTTKQGESVACSATTAILPSVTARLKTCYLPPLSTFEIKTDAVECVVSAGREDVFDIQVYKTENFIANGLVSHNTRWHEDDLGGRILERERSRWHLIELAMEALPNDPLGREVGQRLWPEWFTDEMVTTAKMDMRAWNALYQQQPAADEGDFFKREWMAEYDRLPNDLRIYAASDYGVTDSGGDYTEHGVFGVDHQGNLFVLDWWRGQTSADVWIERKCD